VLKLLLLLPIILPGFSSFGQENDSKLPKTWDKDFVITYSYHSSMSGGKTEIKITFDSCTYKSQSHHSKKPTDQAFKLKEADRAAILKKLAELKADQINYEHNNYPVHDGWSESFCLGTFCVEGGTSVEMDEANKNAFSMVCNYLQEFADKKKK